MAGKDEFKSKVRALFDIATGKAKRAAGELTGRPDMVLGGEAQETKGIRKRKRARRLPG